MDTQESIEVEISEVEEISSEDQGDKRARLILSVLDPVVFDDGNGNCIYS